MKNLILSSVTSRFDNVLVVNGTTLRVSDTFIDGINELISQCSTEWEIAEESSSSVPVKPTATVKKVIVKDKPSASKSSKSSKKVAADADFRIGWTDKDYRAKTGNKGKYKVCLPVWPGEKDGKAPREYYNQLCALSVLYGGFRINRVGIAFPDEDRRAMFEHDFSKFSKIKIKD